MSHHREAWTTLRVAGVAVLALILAGACKPPARPVEEPPVKAAPALRPTVRPETPPEFAAVNDPDLIKLKEALLVGTAEALIPYFERPETMAPGGQLTPYDQAYLRGESQGGTGPLNSVREILKEEPITVLATRQESGDWIAVFIPERKLKSHQIAKILEAGWLTDYFACWVDRVDGKVKIVQNFCFNETGGPYPADY